MSGLWCVNVGYGRTSIADAVYAQMQQLPFYNSFFQTTNPPAAQLAATLVEISPPQFNHVFFTGSGSEGNDTVVRMVRRYWDLQNQPQRHVIISRKNAYHGSTMAGASLGGMSYMHEQGGLPIPDIVHIDQPYYLEHGKGMALEEFGLEAASWLEKKILEMGADKVAAFIGEPVQGAGGVIIPPSTYWPEIQRICDKYGILLVTDEVICGFGRLGYWFGCEKCWLMGEPSGRYFRRNMARKNGRKSRALDFWCAASACYFRFCRISQGRYEYLDARHRHWCRSICCRPGNSSIHRLHRHHHRPTIHSHAVCIIYQSCRSTTHVF